MIGRSSLKNRELRADIQDKGALCAQRAKMYEIKNASKAKTSLSETMKGGSAKSFFIDI